MIPYLLMGLAVGWFLGFWAGVNWEQDRIKRNIIDQTYRGKKNGNDKNNKS